MAKKNRGAQEEPIEEQVLEQGETTEEGVEQKPTGENVFTYVGNGESPPRRINFMGKQIFTRGVPVKVTHPDLLKKLKDHPCFTQEEVDQGALHDMDEDANKVADAQRQKDAKTNASVLKKMAAWGKKGEEE